MGRIITGIGVGCGFVVAPVYIAEITPPHVRGRLTSFTGGWVGTYGCRIQLGQMFLFPLLQTLPAYTTTCR